MLHLLCTQIVEVIAVVSCHLAEELSLRGSCKQKLNGKSSTDNKINGVDDFMGQILYTLYFMRAQGYDATHNILF